MKALVVGGHHDGKVVEMIGMFYEHPVTKRHSLDWFKAVYRWEEETMPDGLMRRYVARFSHYTTRNGQRCDSLGRKIRPRKKGGAK